MKGWAWAANEPIRMESKSDFDVTTNEQKKKTSNEKYLFYLFQVRRENASTAPAEKRERKESTRLEMILSKFKKKKL